MPPGRISRERPQRAASGTRDLTARTRSSASSTRSARHRTLLLPGPGQQHASVAHRKVLEIRNDNNLAAGSHATFVAGCAAGDDFNNPGGHANRGSAWAARLVSGTTSDVTDNSLLSELSDAAAMGATIHSNSWHDDTAGSGNPATYNQNAADVDTFTWNNEDHLVLGSAGNTGEEQGPPGTAKNAICVCAAQADPNEMNIGDGNPTADGRRKPDLVGVGCGITSSNVNTGCGVQARGCATSWATPHMAGNAALVRQHYTEGFYPTGTQQPHHAFVPSGALVKATLINSTIDMTGQAGYPSNLEGWGLIRLQDALFLTGNARRLRVWDRRNAEGINTGEQHEYHLDVAGAGQPLRITLVWTDPPGAANSATPVVNNLDLEVVAPGGARRFWAMCSRAVSPRREGRPTRSTTWRWSSSTPRRPATGRSACAERR